MNALKLEKKKQILNALVEGNSIRSTERMTGCHRDTITRLLVEMGSKCESLLNHRVKDFHSKFIQVDEIWCYVLKKDRYLTKEQQLAGLIGSQYCFIAMDAETKLIPTYQVGKRDMENTVKFIFKLKDKLKNNGRIQLTSDGWKSYVDAIQVAFGGDIDFARLIKLYSSKDTAIGNYLPSKIKGVLSTIVNGNPNPKYISTSYVERQNLTIRMQMRRFTRLTNAFSKKLENLKAALALHFAYYNFMRVHKTLKTTPAMAAGITDHVWRWEELI